MRQILVGNTKIDVVRKPIKNLHLGVYPPRGRVRIASPLNTSDEALRLFAISKLSWINRQQRKFKNQERETVREFISRESHYLFGKRYLLNIIEDVPPAKVIVNHAAITLIIRPGLTRLQRQTFMNEWYRKEMKKVIPGLLKKWEKIVGVSASVWGVKLMKTRWGTCTVKDKRIWLNLELARKPIHCLEYIIVHELVHLRERRHNDRFLRLMDSFMPLWKSHRSELNRLPVSHANWSY